MSGMLEILFARLHLCHIRRGRLYRRAFFVELHLACKYRAYPPLPKSSSVSVSDLVLDHRAFSALISGPLYFLCLGLEK